MEGASGAKESVQQTGEAVSEKAHGKLSELEIHLLGWSVI